MSNPAFKRDPSKGDLPIEKHVIHLYRKYWCNKTNKYKKGWRRRTVGKKRALIICDNNISVSEASEQTGISYPEVLYLRTKFGVEQPRAEPVRELTAFERYQRDIEESYNQIPLGADGPIHTEQYYFPSTINSRMSEVGTRTIKY